MLEPMYKTVASTSLITMLNVIYVRYFYGTQDRPVSPQVGFCWNSADPKLRTTKTRWVVSYLIQYSNSPEFNLPVSH